MDLNAVQFEILEHEYEHLTSRGVIAEHPTLDYYFNLKVKSIVLNLVAPYCPSIA